MPETLERNINKRIITECKMPTYDYECTKCKHKFQLFQPITSKPRTRCPKCRSSAQRLISGGGGIIFKGSGFYVTDYKRKEEKKKPDPDQNRTQKHDRSEEKKPPKPGESKKDKAKTDTKKNESEKK
jgi:putative FmdB family regulatory protein